MNDLKRLQSVGAIPPVIIAVFSPAYTATTTPTISMMYRWALRLSSRLLPAMMDDQNYSRSLQNYYIFFSKLHPPESSGYPVIYRLIVPKAGSNYSSVIKPQNQVNI